MMDIVYQTSTLTIREPEVEEFTWNFNISPRSKIQKNIESVALGGLSFNGLQFKSGFLSELDHKWGLTFYANQINVVMSLQSRDRNNRYTVYPSSLELISLDEVKSTHTLNFERDGSRSAPIMLWTAFWINNEGAWDDSVDMVRVVFRIAREFTGTCIQTLVSDKTAAYNSSVLNSSKILNSSEFFLSPHLSDVTLQCQGESYPAHRFLLSCRSPVFAQMFRTEMREKREGLVVIDDMEPPVLRQLLEFMYCGEVDLSLIPDKVCSGLFRAADKYNLAALKVLCEHEMVKKINKGNCVENYTMAELYNARLLKEQCWDMIRLHKREIFKDRQIFRNFSVQHSDVIFRLFHS